MARINVTAVNTVASLVAEAVAAAKPTAVKVGELPITPAKIVAMVKATMPARWVGDSTSEGFVAMAEFAAYNDRDKKDKVYPAALRLVCFRDAAHLKKSTTVEADGAVLLKTDAYVASIKEEQLALYAKAHAELVKQMK